MKQQQRWSDFSPAQQAAIVAGGALEVVVTTFAIVDLARRPRAGVRGPKLLWLVGFVVQPVGPLAYLAFGRRAASADA
jgi:hypothetical protein